MYFDQYAYAVNSFHILVSNIISHKDTWPSIKLKTDQNNTTWSLSKKVLIIKQVLLTGSLENE